MRVLLGIFCAGALAACDPAVPDSGAGIGFDTLGATERDRQLAQGVRSQPTTVLPPAETGAPASAIAGLGTQPAAAPSAGVTNAAGISSEQDFDAVSAQRDIEADAARIEAARQQYQLVQPTELERVGDTGPNIIQYALSTTHSVGEKKHRRGNPFARSRLEQKCAGYRTDDVAQEQFLAAGGPRRDRLGLDPDGDGFACGWNPSTYRSLVRN